MPLVSQTLWTQEPVGTASPAAAAAITSDPIECVLNDPEYLMFRVTGGAPDVKIQFVISNDGVNFNTASSQATMLLSTATAWATSNVEDWHVLTCPAAPWIKLVVTELTGTEDATKVDATLWLREQG